jgi:hypothetical protein
MIALPFAAQVQAKDLYRYRNIEGNVVIGYRVPVEYAGAGYEVLNDEGVVLKVVPRMLTEEERKSQNAEEKQLAAAAAEQERLRKWDESLMLRYSTIEDIEAARDRALGELQIRVSILRGNRRSLKHTVENYQSQAADLERRGMAVDVGRLRAIKDLQAEIIITERSIEDRQSDILSILDSYQADIERFEMLLKVVELRRTLQFERQMDER